MRWMKIGKQHSQEDPCYKNKADILIIYTVTAKSTVHYWNCDLYVYEVSNWFVQNVVYGDDIVDTFTLYKHLAHSTT